MNEYYIIFYVIFVLLFLMVLIFNGKKIYRNLYKYKYIKVYSFDDNKTVCLEYHKIKTFKPNFLLNSNHIFNHNGFQTVLITNKSSETINPLDFKSQFSKSDFITAIESKSISEALGTLKTNKLDLVKILLFANFFVTMALLYILLKSTESI